MLLCLFLVVAGIADVHGYNRLRCEKAAAHALKLEKSSKKAGTKPSSCSDVLSKISSTQGAKLMSYSNGSAQVCFIGSEGEFYDFLINMKQWENIGKINSMTVKNKENNHIEALLNVDFGKV